MRPVLFLFLLASAHAGDWLTYGHDPQRTGWAFEETSLTPDNVSKMTQLWKSKLQNESYSLYSLTPPVVAGAISTGKGVRSVVYVAGITGTVFGLDAETGEQLWTRAFKYVVQPGKGPYQGTFLCPNGITATPVVDKATNLLYVVAGNGALYGLDLGSGAVRYGPVQMVAPYSKSASLNLVDGVLYTVLAQGCGGGLSGFYAVDVRDRHHPVVHQMLLSNTDTAGIWGRGGAIAGSNGRIYGGTADGVFDQANGDYSDTEIAVSARDLASSTTSCRSTGSTSGARISISAPRAQCISDGRTATCWRPGPRKASFTCSTPITWAAATTRPRSIPVRASATTRPNVARVWASGAA